MWAFFGVPLFFQSYTYSTTNCLPLPLLISVLGKLKSAGLYHVQCYFYFFESFSIYFWMNNNFGLMNLQNNMGSNPLSLLDSCILCTWCREPTGFEISGYCANQTYKSELILWIKILNPQNSNSISPLSCHSSESLQVLLMYLLMANSHQA